MDQWCSSCTTNGRKFKLRPFQINLEEAVLLCSNTKCVNEFNSNPIFLKRKAATGIKRVRKKKTKTDLEELDKLIDSVPANGSTELDDIEKMLLSIDDGSAVDTDFISSSLKELFDNIPSDKLIEPIVKQNFTLISESFDNNKDSDSKAVSTFNYLSKINDDLSRDCDEGYGSIVDASSPMNYNENLESYNAKLPSTLAAITINTDPLKNIVAAPEPKSVINKFKKMSSVECSNIQSLVNDIQVEDCKSKTIHNSEQSNVRYPLWKNGNSFCWLDALLSLITHNRTIRSVILQFDSIPCLTKLITLYDYCVEQINLDTPDLDNIDKVDKMMDNIRLEVFAFLQIKMKCEKAAKDNPWFGLLALLALSPSISNIFDFEGEWKFECTSCGLTSVEKKRKTPLSFQFVPKSFQVPDNIFIETRCTTCLSDGQKKTLNCLTLPPVLAIQFGNGATHKNISKFDFVHNNVKYNVAAIIQYNNQVQHFVTWIRDIKKEKWLNCDDLQASSASFKSSELLFPIQEIHVIVWEKEATFLPTKSLPIKSLSEKVCESFIANNEIPQEIQKPYKSYKQVQSAESAQKHSALSTNMPLNRINKPNPYGITTVRDVTCGKGRCYLKKTIAKTVTQRNSNALLSNKEQVNAVLEKHSKTDQLKTHTVIMKRSMNSDAKDFTNTLSLSHDVSSSSMSEKSNASDGDCGISSLSKMPPYNPTNLRSKTNEYAPKKVVLRTGKRQQRTKTMSTRNSIKKQIVVYEASTVVGVSTKKQNSAKVEGILNFTNSFFLSEGQ